MITLCAIQDSFQFDPRVQIICISDIFQINPHSTPIVFFKSLKMKCVVEIVIDLGWIWKYWKTDYSISNTNEFFEAKIDSIKYNNKN